MLWLELRNLRTFVRSEIFLGHLIEVVLAVVVLALAILLLPFLQRFFSGR